MKLFLGILLSFVIIEGCKKDKNEPNPIVGNWEWIITYGNIYIPTVTPDSLGFNLTYKFDNDNLVQLLLDSTVYRSGKYFIISQKVSDGKTFYELIFNWNTPRPLFDNRDMKIFIGTCNAAYYQIKNDTLILNYSECDISVRKTKTEMFIRKK